MATQPGSYGRSKPGNDIYTVLAAIALAVVVFALSYVIYRSNELLGEPFPSFIS